MLNDYMMYIFLYIGIAIVAIGIVMEVIMIRGISSTQYVNFEAEYRQHISMCFKYGILLIICMWFFTTGQIDSTVTKSLMYISCAWFMTFLYAMFKLLEQKIKKDNSLQTRGASYINISSSCLFKFLITAAIVWFTR